MENHLTIKLESLQNSKYSNYKTFIDNIGDPILKAVLKFKDHNRIIHIIQAKCKVNPFVFPIETSHLLCSAKQMTGFCMKRNTEMG